MGMQFGLVVRALRRVTSLSQNNLAKKADIYNGLSALERGLPHSYTPRDFLVIVNAATPDTTLRLVAFLAGLRDAGLIREGEMLRSMGNLASWYCTGSAHPKYLRPIDQCKACAQLDCQDVLDHFSAEENPAFELERYLRDYPQYTADLNDLARKLAREVPFPALRGSLGLQEARSAVDGEVSDCRSPEGVTIGLIDALITVARVLRPRLGQESPEVTAALVDLRQDEDMSAVLSAPDDACLAAEKAIPDQAPLTNGEQERAREEIRRKIVLREQAKEAV